MNLNHHNYEEYLIDYLEGNLNPEQLGALEAFLAANPDIADEVNALASYMPILVPDDNITYTHKAALKKPEDTKSVPFWGNVKGRFFVLSLAAAFLLFAVGWWVVSNTMQENNAHPGTQVAQNTGNATNGNNNETALNTTTNTNTIQNTPEQTNSISAQNKTTTQQTPETSGIKNSKTNSIASKPASTLCGKTSGSAKQSMPQITPSGLFNAGIAQQTNTQAGNTSFTTTQHRAIPSAIITKQAIQIVNVQTTLPVLALQTTTVNKPTITVTEQSEEQKLAQEDTRTRMLKGVARLLFDRKKERSSTPEAENHESLIAQLTNSIIPEAYRETNKPIDPSITFSLSVNSNTHRFIKDLINR